MTTAADVRNDNCLPPPQPPDEKGTRPLLDREHVNRQVRGVQTFLAAERERKARLEEEWEKAKKVLKGDQGK